VILNQNPIFEMGSKYLKIVPILDAPLKG
jgi:hypothetical protein